MLSAQSRRLVWLALLGSVLHLTACLPWGLPIQQSPLTIQGVLSKSTTEEIVEAHCIISRGKHVYQEIVPLLDGTFEATILIPLGQWELTVLLVDSAGKVHYQSAAQSIHINPGQPTICEIILGSANSRVQIEIDLDNYIFRNQARRARINFNDTIYELIREEANDPFSTEIEVAPGSYEFKIELYSESFRIGDRLGPGFWQLIDVLPEEELTITFRPATEELHIVCWIELLLPAPTNLELQVVQGQAHLSWDALPQTIRGYFVFAQTDPLERFELLTPVPVPEPHFYHDLEGALPSRIGYTVAAVSEKGLVGYYSSLQILDLE